jgi:hypothetical protein
MRIEVQALIQLFGLSIESSQLQSGLRSMGFEAKVSIPSLRKLGSQSISDEKRGIVLMFSERAQFEQYFGEPRSSGEGVFCGLSVYPSGFKSFAPYSGSVGNALEGVKRREQMHQALAHGVIRDEDAGVVYEESWQIAGINLFAKYADDGQIKSLQFNLPMRGA